MRSKPSGRHHALLGSCSSQSNHDRKENSLCPASLQLWLPGQAGLLPELQQPPVLPELSRTGLQDPLGCRRPAQTHQKLSISQECAGNTSACRAGEKSRADCGSLPQLLPLPHPTQGQGGAGAASRGPSCRCHAGTCQSQQWRHCYYTWPQSPFKALKDELCFIYIKEAISEPICDQICCQRNFALSHYI